MNNVMQCNVAAMWRYWKVGKYTFSSLKMHVVYTDRTLRNWNLLLLYAHTTLLCLNDAVKLQVEKLLLSEWMNCAALLNKKYVCSFIRVM